MSAEAGKVSLVLEADSSGLKKAVSTSSKQAADSMVKSFEGANAKIQKVLDDNERSMKSKAASIAGIYRSQGMSSSDAMKNAWNLIERGSSQATNSANGNFERLGRNGSSAALTIQNAFSRAFKAIAAVAASKALIDFSKKCISLGSDLAEVQNVVDVTFTSMSGKVDKFAQDAMYSYGLSEKMAKQFTGTFGAMSKSFGFAEDKAYEMSTSLTGLAGDVASFYNMSQEEAYTKLKSVFTGETESLKELGVVMTQSALDQYALANGFGKVSAKMTEQEKISLRYAFVQSKLASASGDFGRTQLSWANQTRIAVLQTEAAMAQFGQGLINIFRPALIWGNAVLAKIVQIATGFNKLTAALFGSTGSITGGLTKSKTAAAGLAANLGSAEKSGTGLSNTANKSGSGLNKAAKAAEKLKRTIAGFDKVTKLDGSTSSGTTGNVGTGGVGIPSGGIDTGGIDDLTASTTATSQAMEKLSGWTAQLKSWVDDLDLNPMRTSFDHLKESAGNLGDTLAGGLKWGLENVLAPLAKWTIEKGGPLSIELFADALDILDDGINVLKPGAKWLWDSLLSPLAEAAGDTFTAGLVGLDIVLDDVHAKMQDLTALVNNDMTFTEMLNKWLAPVDDSGYDYSKIMPLDKEAVWAALGGGDDKHFDLFGMLFDDNFVEDTKLSFKIMTDSVIDFKDTLFSLPGKVTTSLSMKAEQTVSDVKGWWSSRTAEWKAKTSDMKLKAETAASSVKSWWSDRVAGWKEKTAGLTLKAESTAASIKTAWENATKWWKDKKASLSLKFSASASDLRNWMNTNMIGKINSAFAKFPILNKVKIPKLAQGGYVRANTPQLAMIGDNRHQGEVVSPEKKLRDMAVEAARMAGNGGSDPELKALLKAILNQLESAPYVRLNPEELRRYFIRETNRQTRLNGGACELML